MRSLAREAALVGARAIAGAKHPTAGAAKGLPGDWVTDVDLASERAIGAMLGAGTPDIPVQGEELSGELATGLRWVVDPLDGTTNYLHGFPAVGVSVALVGEEEVLAGAIAAPLLGDVWHGAAGRGATWEHDGSSVACRVSDRPPERAVVATGFPFRRKERLPRYLETMRAALEAFEDLRRPGAACLDLAWTACGVFDGFFELGLAPWDVAAGALLIQEAGGVVTDWEGGPGFLTGNIMAAPAQVHGPLLAAASVDG